MKKIYLFMLMAVGLLISGSMFAAPERPVPPTEPKAPEGVVLLDHGNLPHGLVSRSSVNAAPRRAAMADLMATLYRGGEKFKDYMYTDDDYTLLFGEEGDLQDGDSLVLAKDLYVSYIDFYKSIVLDLNGYTICGSEYGIYIGCTGNFKVMNGSIQSTSYLWESNTDYGSYGIYVGSGNVLIDNVDITSSDEEGPYYGVYISGGAVEMQNSSVYAYYYGVYNSKGTTITLSDNDIFGFCYGIRTCSGTLNHNSGKLSSYYYALYAYSCNSYITVNIDGGVFENDPTENYQLVFMHSYSTSYKSEANINGGYFKGSGYDIFQYCSNVTIKGGYFYKPENGTMFSDYQTKIKLEGGYYDKQDAIVTPAGYSFGKPVNDGLYGTLVYPLIQAKATTGGYGFASVEEALADVDFDGTIKLIGNVEDATINKDVTLDLDIYSITGTLTVTNNAKVSVKSFDTGNIHDLVAAKEDVVLYGGNYDFQPSTKATLADGLDERENTPSAGKYMVCQAAVASIFRGEGTPEEITYWTLQDAINDAQAGEKILINKDMSILNEVTIAKGKNITIDLNGHVVSGQRNPTNNWQLVMNNGTLTLMDNTDVNKDGTGTGKFTTENFYTADVSFSPTYGVYVINNAGNLTIESGLYESFGVGFATYCIQQGSGAYTTTINGGKFYTIGGSYAIRMFFPNTLDSKVDINGGIIGSLWVQSGSKFTLHIQNATILKNLGIEATTTDFDILLKNIVMGSDWTLTGDARNAYAEGKYVVDSVRISGYNLQGNLGDAAFKHLSNGQYQFEDAYMGNENANSWKKYYSEEEGYFAIPIPNNPAIVQVYKSGQANFRAFMPYIVDGYGLVPYINEAEGITAEDKWFEIVPLAKGEEYGDPDTDEQTTRIDPEGGNDESNLANLWHKPDTWVPGDGWGEEGHEEEIPVSGDPVVIDHNVIVEKDSTAEAASIIIEPGQKLIVQEGATLHIEDAGAIFKDETAQLIVEPNAVVTVGSNGIVADDEDNVIVKASETEQGVFMCDPEVKINTKPKATVYLYTKAKQLRGAPKYEYIYQRFAIPTDDGEATVYGDDYAGQELFEGGTNYVDAVFAWDKDNLDWKMLARWKDMKPFEGYQVTNNTKNGGITYSFEGNLVGNHNSNFEFAYHPEGFQFFGNSYTAPIYIPTFLDSIQKHNGNEIQYSIWVYDEGDDNFKAVTKVQAEEGLVNDSKGNPIKEIRSMQAFIMKGEEGSSTDLSYEGAIWGNPRFENRLPGSAQTSRRTTALDMDIATIIVKAQNGQGDQVLLMQSNNFSDEFENGSDASKYIYAEGINLYANTNCGKLSNVATDNVDGTILAFKSGVSSEYTIRFDNLNGEMFTLVDMVTGTQVAMTEGNEYTFSQAPNTDNEVRFMVMGEHKAPTGNENIKTNKITKVVENGQFYIVKEGIRYNAVGASFNK